jgi:hypothetical protein
MQAAQPQVVLLLVVMRVVQLAAQLVAQLAEALQTTMIRSSDLRFEINPCFESI